ncbi:MAG TPA: hypothetical protein VED01_19500 [Burkholderiales bacterium]|nr:hypothetical protein [Burkholderiales bacterium]
MSVHTQEASGDARQKSGPNRTPQLLDFALGLVLLPIMAGVLDRGPRPPAPARPRRTLQWSFAIAAGIGAALVLA